ncbi:MAG: hypothetical protein RRY20_08650 [Bilophila sp.]
MPVLKEHLDVFQSNQFLKITLDAPHATLAPLRQCFLTRPTAIRVPTKPEQMQIQKGRPKFQFLIRVDKFGIKLVIDSQEYLCRRKSCHRCVLMRRRKKTKIQPPDLTSGLDLGIVFSAFWEDIPAGVAGCCALTQCPVFLFSGVSSCFIPQKFSVVHQFIGKETHNF